MANKPPWRGDGALRKSRQSVRPKRRPARNTARRRPTRKLARRRKRSSNARYLRHIADAGVFCFMVLIGAAAVFAFIARDLPDTRELWRSAGGPKITLLASDGSPLTLHGASIGARSGLRSCQPMFPMPFSPLKTGIFTTISASTRSPSHALRLPTYVTATSFRVGRR